jgi:SNF2 family DNA or RNA helicase
MGMVQLGENTSSKVKDFTLTNEELNEQNLREKLETAYRKLDSISLKILYIHAFAYAPLSKDNLLKIWDSCVKKQVDNFTPLNLKTLKPYIDTLKELEFLNDQKGKGIICNRSFIEVISREVAKTRYFKDLVKSIKDVTDHGSSFYYTTPAHLVSEVFFIRELRIALYQGDLPLIEKMAKEYNAKMHYKDKIVLSDLLAVILNNPFDAKWLSTLPAPLYERCVKHITNLNERNCAPNIELTNLLDSQYNSYSCENSDALLIVLAKNKLLRGELDDVAKAIDLLYNAKSNSTLVIQAALKFLQGQNKESINDYETALKNLKITETIDRCFNCELGVFYILALIKEGSHECLEKAYTQVKKVERKVEYWLRVIYSHLLIFLEIQLGQTYKKEILNNILIDFPERQNSFETIFLSLIQYWADPDRAKKSLISYNLEKLYFRSKNSGYWWFVLESTNLLSKLMPNSKYKESANDISQQTKLLSITDLVEQQEPWELSLKALTALYREGDEREVVSVPVQRDQRLVWFISYNDNACFVTPKEQKLGSNGEWSKGRSISLKRLREDKDKLSFLSAQDIKACKNIDETTSFDYGFWGKKEFYFKSEVLVNLIGHPLVFWEEAPHSSVELVKGEPELVVKKEEKGFLDLKLSPNLLDFKDIIAIKESPTRIKIIKANSKQRQLADIIGRGNSLKVPLTAEKSVLAAIKSIASIVTVHSDIGGNFQGAEEVLPNSTIHIHLLPISEGLKAALLYRPFTDGGSYYRPGVGGEVVIADINGKRLQTRRNLVGEKQQAEDIIQLCPTLLKFAEEEEDYEWYIDDAESSLELLLELQSLGEKAVIEWPQGEKLRVKRQVDSKDFTLSINRQQDWFAASGELKIDKGLILNMVELIGLLEKSSSRFIPIGDGEFLALTKSFRKRLEDLRIFSEKTKSGLRFHPLATLGLEDFIDEVGQLKGDSAWKEHRKRLQELQNIEPKLPSTFKAELRDYQNEGYVWLSRLAHWGVGACLADQMGLGKTVQALGVILSRAEGGPTLIIAPTSVCMNWISEAQKFAPTLNIVQFSDCLNVVDSTTKSQRQELVSNLSALDVLVCSYGLLQQEEVSQILSLIEWQTIVLDEAQAIKNKHTKRSQAAMNLKGRFKLLTTGTPIENHLGELWNLFRFINPGLLGSAESFNERFAIPIERFQDHQVRNKLKKLVKPFILRRTKSQVLEELPPRTEIMLKVELSAEEFAFYEALRIKAVSAVKELETSSSGEKHLKVLAEIMKLRRACCHPKLVLTDSDLNSSKLQSFAELLAGLLENGHKVLVFSQFVDHLKIVKDHLETEKISYQYLDGSTPALERKKRVDAFQSGIGDVFLISLKAGGTGLNLTAADYVIHLDPWWNPAVEDQASDRAHRIGQKRPVTIYRLVAKDTIEDKIVELHQHKRDLADSLLEGTNISGKLSTEALLDLIVS